MRTRIITAAVGIPALLAILLACPPWAACALCAVLAAVGCYELLCAIGGAGNKKLFWLIPVAALSVLLIGLRPNDVRLFGVLSFAAFAGSMITAVFSYGGKKPVSFTAVAGGLLGGIGIPAALACVALLRNTSPALSLLPFIGAFASDAGAYFAGMYLGKRKLAPKVSPHKTVAGCVGGFIGAVVVMLLYRCIAFRVWNVDIAWQLYAVLGILGSLFGQAGDLSFSVIKREFGIKDYGTLFPGHGGVYDRFDSVIFVAPAYWLLLTHIF